MADLKVDYDGSDANEITIYASPETLREIADQLETRAAVSVAGTAVDLAEPATISFSDEWEEEA